jgi:GNAT superfamily N-acetyltransferase
MVEVRLATRADAPWLGALIDEMDRHYRGADAVQAVGTAAAMIERTFDTAEGTRFLLAIVSGKPVGIACFAVIRPGRGHAGLIFLKDLFVVENERGKGVGRSLMKQLAAFALAHNIGRIDLTTDHSNTGAQKLYSELGGLARPKVLYTFDGDVLSRLAAS